MLPNGWRLLQCELLTKNLNRNEMTKAEEIYHRLVQYEWNEIGDAMKKSILDAINEGYKKGYNDATKEACAEIAKNYQPNDR